MSQIPKSLQWIRPKLKNVLDFHSDDIMLYLNCHHLATIQGFNPANQTASATIDYQMVQYVFDQATGLNQQRLVPYPPLAECPVIFQCGTDGGLTFPLEVGDKCMVLFNDRDLDNWFAGAIGQAPPTARLHSFCDALILVGPRIGGNPLPNFSTVYSMLRNGDGTSYVGINKSNGKIRLQNPSGNLETILQSLISTLQGLTVNTVTGVPLPPWLTNLNNIATELGNLLE